MNILLLPGCNLESEFLHTQTVWPVGDATYVPNQKCAFRTSTKQIPSQLFTITENKAINSVWQTPQTPPQLEHQWFVCLFAFGSFPVTFEGVKEDLRLIAKVGRSVIAVLLGVVFHRRVAAWSKAKQTAFEMKMFPWSNQCLFTGQKWCYLKDFKTKLFVMS